MEAGKQSTRGALVPWFPSPGIWSPQERRFLGSKEFHFPEQKPMKAKKSTRSPRGHTADLGPRRD